MKIILVLVFIIAVLALFAVIFRIRNQSNETSLFEEFIAEFEKRTGDMRSYDHPELRFAISSRMSSFILEARRRSRDSLESLPFTPERVDPKIYKLISEIDPDNKTKASEILTTLGHLHAEMELSYSEEQVLEIFAKSLIY